VLFWRGQTISWMSETPLTRRVRRDKWLWSAELEQFTALLGQLNQRLQELEATAP